MTIEGFKKDGCRSFVVNEPVLVLSIIFLKLISIFLLLYNML